MYKRKELAIAHYLAVMREIAVRYGDRFVLPNLPDYIDVGEGHRIAKASVKRYIDHIVRYCEENGIDPCPVKKELIPDQRCGRVTLVTIDVDAAEKLIYELQGRIELKKSISMEYRKKIEYLQKELRECRASLEKCREELRKLRKPSKEVEKLEELSKEIGRLRRALEEKEAEVRKVRETVEVFVSRLVSMLSRRELKRCIYATDFDPVCLFVLKLLDIVTAGKDRALIDDFVDRWESDPEFVKKVGELKIEDLQRMLGEMLGEKS